MATIERGIEIAANAHVGQNDNSRPERAPLRAEGFDSDLAKLKLYYLSYKFLTDKISEADCRRLVQD